MTIFSALTVFGLVHALLGAPSRYVEDRLEQIARAANEQSESGGLLASVPVWRVQAARLASRILPRRLREWLDRQLMVAGNPVSIESLILVQMAAPVLVSAALLPVMVAGLSPRLVVLIVALTLAGPAVWVSGRATRRRAAIENELPDFVDLLVVSVEAGLGFEGALSRIGEYMDGPLGEEVAHVRADLGLGVGRRRALQGFAERSGVAGVASFTSAVLQAEQTGMGVARVLRAQSEQLRAERRARAQAAALQAPLKMLFPLVFFIFPTLFIVILGPAVLQLSQAFDSSP